MFNNLYVRLTSTHSLTVSFCLPPFDRQGINLWSLSTATISSPRAEAHSVLTGFLFPLLAGLLASACWPAGHSA